MGTLLDVFAAALVFSFIFCCIVSGILQVIAWSRHSLEGAPVSLRALWRPEGYFDPIGLRQIALARRLLTLGAVAYLSYGVILIASSVMR